MRLRAPVLVSAIALVACGRQGPIKTPTTDVIAVQLPLSTYDVSLPNGLRVLVQEDHQTPAVALRIEYRVGAWADPEGRSGFAHLFEHMMFEGSKHVARGEFEATMSVGGARFNAETSSDSTVYFETFPKAMLDKVLWLESDRMGFLLERLDQKMLDEVRTIVKNEQHERTETRPFGGLAPAVNTRLFPHGHPYHHSVGGVAAELDQATLEDVRSFFLRWYAPNQATLVIVGDVDTKDVLARVARWFSPIPPGPPAPKLPKFPVPRAQGDKRLVFQASVDAPRISMSWAIPAFNEPDEVALLSAAQLLERWAGDFLGKRARRVVVDEWAGQFGGALTLHVSLPPDGSVDAILPAIDGALADFSAPKHWKRPDALVKASLYEPYTIRVLNTDGPTLRAATIATFDRLTGSPLGVLDRLRAFERLEPDAVLSAFDRYVHKAPRMIAIVQPTKDAPVGGRLSEES